MIKKNCIICGNEFNTYPSKVKIGRGKYCSKICASVTLFKSGVSFSPNTTFKKGMIIPEEWKAKWVGRKPWNKNVIGVCKPNSTTFKKGFVYSERTQYKKGNVSWSKINKHLMPSRDLHPNWQGGKSFEPYPLGWNKTFKEQIRMRDCYKCYICGVSEAEHGKRLAVHHIDYNKDNLSLDNLVSLCFSCHGKTNFNRDEWLSFLKGCDVNARRE